ncbi:MAG: c-type cytochrome [Pseudomonadota bacterium]
MRLSNAVLSVGLALGLVAGLAAAGDARLGEQVAGACADCHGREGNGRNDKPGVPRLAGQSEAYLVKQMFDIRHGRRQHGAAGGFEPLTLVQIEGLAAHYAHLPRGAGTPGNVYAVADGRRYFEERNCRLCHGVDGEGNLQDGQIPRLGGQGRQYLINAMKDFQSGQRRNDRDGVKPFFFSSVADQDIEALAEYLSSR